MCPLYLDAVATETAQLNNIPQFDAHDLNTFDSNSEVESEMEEDETVIDV